MTIGSLTVTPSAAAQAYAKTASVDTGSGGNENFGTALANSLNGALQAGEQADATAVQGLNGQGDLTQIVTSVTQAEMALQTTVALRDRMVQAYQSIMNMPI